MTSQPIKRRALKALIVVSIAAVLVSMAVWITVPPFRVWVLCTMATTGKETLSRDARARLISGAARAADTGGIESIGQIMTAEDPAFALMVMIEVREASVDRFDELMREWLADDTVAFPNDGARQLRRCDLASYYFSPLLGYGAFDKMDCLALEVERRDSFRARIVQRLRGGD